MNNNPDLLYFHDRDDLLQYEDARFNSLIQSVANFYSTRNDQSIWGNWLRALAQELGRLDYGYSYDIVNKDPNFLTPPDIRRRWADPLYISSNWPSSSQYDTQYKQMLVQLIQAYRMGTTVDAIEAVILAYTGLNIQVQELYKQIGNGVYDQSDRNTINVAISVSGGTISNPLSIVVSLSQLQTIIQSLYNAMILAMPAHIGLEFTAVFGEGEDLGCILSPNVVTESQFNELDSNQQNYYTLTDYVPISPAIFWRASTAFVLNNVLRDRNGNFQLVTNLGVFPNESSTTQPTWNTLSLGNTTDGNLTYLNISPAVLSTSVQSNIVTVNLSYPVALDSGDVVTLINLGNSTFLNGVALTVLTATGSSFTAAFTHTFYTAALETTGTATFALPTPITISQFASLNSTWQSLYQEQFTNTNCQASGISDTLRIFIQQVEMAPQGQRLIPAPVLTSTNPKTTIAAYGRMLAKTLSSSQWSSLPTVFVNITQAYSDGTNATYFYIPQTQFLHEDEVITVMGFANPALNVTARVHDVYNSVANILSVSIESDILTIFAPNSFTTGMLVNFAGLTSATFLNGQSLIITSASPTSFTANFSHTNYAQTADMGTAEVSTFQITNNTVVPLEAPASATNAGLLSPTLQSAYYLSNGQYVLGTPPFATSGTGIGSSWVPGGNVFQGQIIVDSNGNQQIALNSGTSGANPPAWNLTLNASTNDNGVLWRNLGVNYFSASNNWVGVLNFSVFTAEGTPVPFSGEVGNIDPNHQYGLLAPNLSVWELSGDPQDQLNVIGLF